jgi:hypothetical protein
MFVGNFKENQTPTGVFANYWPSCVFFFFFFFFFCLFSVSVSLSVSFSFYSFMVCLCVYYFDVFYVLILVCIIFSQIGALCDLFPPEVVADSMIRMTFALLHDRVATVRHATVSSIGTYLAPPFTFLNSF